MAQSIHKQLAQVRDLTGYRHLRLGVEESVVSVGFRDDKCWIIVRRAVTEPRRGGYIVRKRGHETILFTRGTGNVWHRDQHVLWDPAGPAEHVSSWPGRTPEEHAQRRDYEEMCHRPGTERSPMDNSDRRRQGYDWY